MKAYVFCIILYVVIAACMFAVLIHAGKHIELIQDENVKKAIGEIALLVWLYSLGLRIPSIYDALKG